MRYKQTFLSKAFDILVTVFFFLFLTFMLNVLADVKMLSIISPFRFFVLVPAKVWIYSGIFACIIDIISEKEICISFSLFKSNAKKYWKIYASVVFVPFVLIYFLKSILNFYDIYSVILYKYCYIGMLYFLAKWIIEDKFLSEGEIKKQKIFLSRHEVVTICLIYIFDIFLFYIPLIMDIGYFDLQNLLSFWIEIIRYLQFIFLASLIIKQYPDVIKNHRRIKELFIISPYPQPSPKIFGIFLSALQLWYQPIFVVLRALTPKDYKIYEFNYTPWHKRYYKKNKLVAITSTTANISEAYKLAKTFRAYGSKVIMGGPHVSFLPKEALEFCDSVVIGEAESVWKEVIDDYEQGCLKREYHGDYLEDYYSQVHRELLLAPEKKSKFFIEAIRGCKYKCDFCLVRPLNGPKLRKKPIEKVVELIKKVKHKYNKISFVDNNIYNDPSYARDLFKALIPLHIRWTAFCSIDMGADAEALKLAKESGCNLLIIGYEIPDFSQEREKGGKFNLVDKYREYAKNIKRAGITADNSLLFGFPSDKLRDLIPLWEFCFSIRSKTTSVALVTPFPGTPIYYDLLKENRLLNLNWRRYDAVHLVFIPKQINRKVLSFLFPFIRNFFYYSNSQRWLMVSAALIILGILFL